MAALSQIPHRPPRGVHTIASLGKENLEQKENIAHKENVPHWPPPRVHTITSRGKEKSKGNIGHL